jgi:hypothetical protein
VLHEATLTLSVRDGGLGRPGSHSESGGEPLASHGRGLQLVELVSTRWGSDPGEDGLTVWCEFDVS